MNNLHKTLAKMKLRTLDQTAQHYKKLNPDTALTRTAIRQMALSGRLPFVTIGRKRLFDLDTIEQYFFTEDPQSEGVRRVEVRQ